MRILLLIALGAPLGGLALLSAPRAQAAPADVQPLAHAHAHNDYEHSRPLHDALARGFCSVEADIWLVNGELLIGHDRRDLQPGRTLESLYLQPLAERARANQGRVFAGGPTFHLLIDVKSDAAATYARLHEVLSRYQELLTSYPDGKRLERAVTVILSGNRAFDAVAGEKTRLVAIDGRPENLDTNPPADLYPWISANWTLLFKAQADGKLATAERDRLHAFVARAHKQQRKVRFWATPEKPQLWAELRSAGVDLINTDQLDNLREFLHSEQQKQP